MKASPTRWRAGPRWRSISLYGRTEATSARVTGVANARARSLEGVRLLRERGVPVSLKTLALADNHHQVGLLRRESEHLGLLFRFDGLVTPRIDGTTANLDTRLSPDQVVALDCANPRRLAAIRDALAAAPPVPASEPRALYWCGAGLNSCSIDPYGRLFVCSQSRTVAWDLRKHPLREGSTPCVAARPSARSRMRCQMRPLCGMCAANGGLEHGNPETPVEFLCEVTHLRVLAAGAENPSPRRVPVLRKPPASSKQEAQSLTAAAGVPSLESPDEQSRAAT